jgi:hypothetical protein
VVNRIKNKDIPSMPKKKFILKMVLQLKNSIYWKLDVELSKKIHKKSENMKATEEKRRAACLIKLLLLLGIIIIMKIPKRSIINK